MLFNRASRNLFNGAYKRFKSTAADVGSSEVAFAGMGAVATTFGTYMIADFLSNFIQHPTQKVCLSVTSRMLNSSTSLFTTDIVVLSDGLRVLQSIHRTVRVSSSSRRFHPLMIISIFLGPRPIARIFL
jgi:hypothetical protein